jgi:hypothetical protein
MNLRQPLVFAAAILFVGFTAIAAYQAFGFLGIFTVLMITLFFVMAVMLNLGKAKLVDEMEVGVIFNRLNNSFSRFVVGLDPEPARRYQNQHTPGWFQVGRRLFSINDPYHVRLKWYEEVKSTIPKKSQTAKGKVENLRTADGIPVTIAWKVSYTVDVTLINEKLKHKMARTLPEHSGSVVTGKVERAIKHLVELRTIQSLYGAGAIQALEQEVSQRAYRQLSHPVNLGFQEIKAKDVSLGPIEMPFKVEKALELAHQRKIQTEMVAGALERLQQAVGSFSKEDVRRLSELERLRILDDKDVKAVYLTDAFVHSQSVKVRHGVNGRSPSKS